MHSLVSFTECYASRSPCSTPTPPDSVQVYFFVSLLMLSCDEVAAQMEQPWHLLPLRALCRGAHAEASR